MAYAVGTAVEHSVNSGGITTVDAPNFTAVAGDSLICVVSNFNVNLVPTLSDTVGTNDSWTEIETGQWNASTGVHIFRLMSAAAGSCTIRATFSGNVGYPAILVVPVTGLLGATDDAVFVTRAAPGTGTDAISSGATNTLAAQPAMIFGLTFDEGSPTGIPAAGTGYTNISSGWTYGGGFTACMRAEHKRVTATPGQAATFTTVDGSHSFVVLAVAFGEAEAGSPGPTLRTTHMARYVTGEMRQ